MLDLGSLAEGFSATRPRPPPPELGGDGPGARLVARCSPDPMAHLMQTRRESSQGDRGEQGGITQWLPTREARVHVNRHHQVSGVTWSLISEHRSPRTCHVCI